MATHSKAPITGKALTYPSISKTGELHGSESGDKVHIRMVLWHETQERRSQRLSQPERPSEIPSVTGER